MCLSTLFSNKNELKFGRTKSTSKSSVLHDHSWPFHQSLKKLAVVERLFWLLGTRFNDRCRCIEVAVGGGSTVLQLSLIHLFEIKRCRAAKGAFAFEVLVRTVSFRPQLTNCRGKTDLTTYSFLSLLLLLLFVGWFGFFMFLAYVYVNHGFILQINLTLVGH